MVVAFIEVETARDRMFRHAAGGVSVDDIIAEGRRPIPKLFHDYGRTWEGRPRYWCAADKPDTDDTFAVAPVYRTSRLLLGGPDYPEDPCCEVCGVSIAALQDMMTEALP